MSKIACVGWMASTRCDACVAINPLGNHDVGRQHDFGPAVRRVGQQHPGPIDEVRLRERMADLFTASEQERVGHPTANQHHIDLADEIAHDCQLVADLGPAKDRDERMLGRPR